MNNINDITSYILFPAYGVKQTDEIAMLQTCFWEILASALSDGAN
jgi:hypothetical protein